MPSWDETTRREWTITGDEEPEPRPEPADPTAVFPEEEPTEPYLLIARIVF
jgi:hypothetical protein